MEEAEYAQKSEEMLEAVKELNAAEVRKLLDEGYPIHYHDECGRNLLHMVSYHSPEDEDFSFIKRAEAKREIIYMLIDAGLDVNLKDEQGNTCLHHALGRMDPDLCEILLQCGADMWATDKEGKTILTEVNEFSNHFTGLLQAKDMDLVFQKYHPGLWKAVESRDISQVRKLTNLWCRTDLIRDGKTLKKLALDTGHEEIISLIFGIHDTMKLVYHLLARNTYAVQEILKTSPTKLQLDLRKMSHRGAPILYFLIEWKDSSIIELFVNHGCHIYTIMRDEFGYDMPVIFSALKSDIPVDVIKALLPKNKPNQEEMLYKLLYKGKTVLEVALEQKVNLEVFDVLVDRGGPLLVMDRNQFNRSVRNIALMTNRSKYTDVIDKNVTSWVLHPDKYHGRRQALALCGWEHMPNIHDEDEEGSSPNQVSAFIDYLSKYQNQIIQLADATEKGNVEKFENLCIFSSEHDLFENNLSWDGRPKGDGLPLLHRAVLFNNPTIVNAILKQKPDCQSVDTLFDQNHRTALHYAYAISTASEIRKLLLDSGCSEHVLDKKSKEPLDFRDKQGDPIMEKLLRRLKSKDYYLPEPDPWEGSAEDCNLTTEDDMFESQRSHYRNLAAFYHENAVHGAYYEEEWFEQRTNFDHEGEFDDDYDEDLDERVFDEHPEPNENSSSYCNMF